MLLHWDSIVLMLPLLTSLAASGGDPTHLGQSPPAVDAGIAQQPTAPPLTTRHSVFFPGYVSPSTTYASPIEKRNLLTTLAVEQGMAVGGAAGHIAPYASLRLSTDDQGFDWNNKAVLQVGVKYVRRISNGVIQVGTAYAIEKRLTSSFKASQPMAFADAWFGWQNALSMRRLRPDSLPGSGWASIGNDTPAERHNVITRLYVEQGVLVATAWGASIVPFVDVTVAADSQGHSWNNSLMFGQGLRLSRRLVGGTVEIAAMYQQERRWVDGSAAQGVGALIRMRRGWSHACSP